jgi:hypothetical protein
LIEENLKNQLEEKYNINEFLEGKIVSERKEEEKREEILTNHLKEIYEDLKKLEE